jgi:multicomponent Na+:H+ antiporter subunit F
MMYIAILLIAVAIGLVLINAARSGMQLNRAISLSLVTSYCVVFICLLGITVEPCFVDMALIYALLSFVGSIAVLRYRTKS